MSTVQGAFEPAELLGNHYHPIGGRYASLELAIEAVKAHSRNKHGGGGAYQVYEPRGGGRDPAIVEVTGGDGDPLLIQSLYKVFETPPGS